MPLNPSVEPSTDLVRKQVNKILASKTFRAARQTGRFLHYVVEQRLEGQELNQYRIAVDVLGRQTNFDPKVDSAVRGAARFLRSKLDQYYTSEGRGDRIRIELPEGAYVPTWRFVRNTAMASQSGRQPITKADPVPGTNSKTGFTLRRNHRFVLASAAAILLVVAAKYTWDWYRLPTVRISPEAFSVSNGGATKIDVINRGDIPVST